MTAPRSHGRREERLRPSEASGSPAIAIVRGATCSFAARGTTRHVPPLRSHPHMLRKQSGFSSSFARMPTQVCWPQGVATCWQYEKRCQ